MHISIPNYNNTTYINTYEINSDTKSQEQKIDFFVLL